MIVVEDEVVRSVCVARVWENRRMITIQLIRDIQETLNSSWFRGCG
jgi:hypothetical protein